MRKLSLIFFATFALYFVVSYISSSFSNFDSQSYHIIGSFTLKGKSIYPDPAISRYPYLPLFLYFEVLTQASSSFLRIPQIFIIKIVLSLFHLFSIYAIYLLTKKNVNTVFFYALNPISLLIIAFHGQFDIIPLTCILFAIVTLQKKLFVKTILLLSLAITLKTWPILFVFPFLKRVPKKFWLYILILPSFFLLLYSFFFHTSVFSIARVLFVYQGVGGIWGLGKILSLFTTNKILLLTYKALFVFGLLLYSYKQRKTMIKEELLELVLLFFIFTPGFGIQWFLWLVPLLFLTKKPYTYMFMTALTICLFIAYSSWMPFTIVSPDGANTVIFLLWPLFIFYFLLFFKKSPAFPDSMV